LSWLLWFQDSRLQIIFSQERLISWDQLSDSEDRHFMSLRWVSTVIRGRILATVQIIRRCTVAFQCAECVLHVHRHLARHLTSSCCTTGLCSYWTRNTSRTVLSAWSSAPIFQGNSPCNLKWATRDGCYRFESSRISSIIITYRIQPNSQKFNSMFPKNGFG
jgi:hypothetical protein